jgi:hypothetical protein
LVHDTPFSTAPVPLATGTATVDAGCQAEPVPVSTSGEVALLVLW